MDNEEVVKQEPDDPERIDTSALRDVIYWIIDGFEREHDCIVTMAEYMLWHPDDMEEPYRECYVHAERKS